MKQHIGHPQHDIIKDMDFETYLYWRCTKDKNYQSEFLVDSNNNFIVDFIVDKFTTEKRDNIDRRKRRGGRPRKPSNENRKSQRRK